MLTPLANELSYPIAGSHQSPWSGDLLNRTVQLILGGYLLVVLAHLSPGFERR